MATAIPTLTKVIKRGLMLPSQVPEFKAKYN